MGRICETNRDFRPNREWLNISLSDDLFDSFMRATGSRSTRTSRMSRRNLFVSRAGAPGAVLAGHGALFSA